MPLKVTMITQETVWWDLRSSIFILAKTVYCIKGYITIQKNDTLELIYKTERLKDMENKLIVTKGAKGEGYTKSLGLAYSFWRLPRW